jgi:hypothetical protein
MNDCPRAEIRDLLPDLVHGHLDPELRADVERHVAGCADCAAEVALLRQMRAALDREIPAIDTARIAAAVNATRESAQRGTAPSWALRRAALIAATILLVAAALLSFTVVREQRRSAQLARAAAVDSLAKMLEQDSSLAQANSALPIAPTPERRRAERDTPVVASAAGAETGRGSRPRTRELASAELTFGGGFQDLSDAELEALLENVDALSGARVIPDEEPDVVLPALSEPGSGGLQP